MRRAFTIMLPFAPALGLLLACGFLLSGGCAEPSAPSVAGVPRLTEMQDTGQTICQQLNCRPLNSDEYDQIYNSIMSMDGSIDPICEDLKEYLYSRLALGYITAGQNEFLPNGDYYGGAYGETTQMIVINQDQILNVPGATVPNVLAHEAAHGELGSDDETTPTAQEWANYCVPM